MWCPGEWYCRTPSIQAVNWIQAGSSVQVSTLVIAQKITPACEADISPLEIKPANGMLPRLPSCGVMSLPTKGYLPSASRCDLNNSKSRSQSACPQLSSHRMNIATVSPSFRAKVLPKSPSLQWCIPSLVGSRKVPYHDVLGVIPCGVDPGTMPFDTAASMVLSGLLLSGDVPSPGSVIRPSQRDVDNLHSLPNHPVHGVPQIPQ